MPTRNETLLAPIDRTMNIIEIGPSFSPVAPKADGWKVHSIDHLPREALVEKYTGEAGVDTSRIEEVDFIWTGGPLSSAVPESLHGSFDALIASHVIEHSPDLIGFLESMATLLHPKGVVALAVPDKRYCFDYFKPLTMAGDVLMAHAERRTRHSRINAFNEVAYSAAMAGSMVWTQEPVRDLSLVHPLEKARDVYLSLAEQTDAPYHDMHAWRFIPASFELLLLELAWLGETDWQVEQITPPSGCEFLAWLRRGGHHAAQSLSAGDLATRRLDLLKRILLETNEQIQDVLADLTQRRPATPALAPAAQPAESDGAINSYFVDWFPRADNAFRIFDGEWSSKLPGFDLGGQATLFEDGRIIWFEEKLGSFAGKRVLELGPLEGAHTMMLTTRGADVLAIEANQRAFLRCLTVKEVFGLSRARFLLGDFLKYLSSNPPRFDFVLASGVLYHMLDPVGFLQSLAAAADTIGLWTHYFDPAAFTQRGQVPANFVLEPRRINTGTREIELYDQKYLDALKWSGFCGGIRSGSVWMTREGILGILEDAGFIVETGVEHRDHPNGPAFCVFARRPVGPITKRATPSKRTWLSYAFPAR